MKEVEIHLATRRQISPRFVEMFNWQTCKDFTLRIITRYPQSWSPEDLNVDFPVEMYHTKLAYSTGTRYAYCLASNEAFCSATSKYVFALNDFSMISPLSVERCLIHADENTCIVGRIMWRQERWEDCLNRDSFKLDTALGPPVFVAYETRDRYNMVGGCLWFPVKGYKAVNGYDLAFDGGWGVADHNLGARLLRAGCKVAQLSGAQHFQHESHQNEKDDPPIADGRWIVNKETGAKIGWEKRAPGYNRWCNEHNIVRALQGLEETCKLLNSGGREERID